MSKLILICISLCLLSCSEKEPLFNSQSYVFGTMVDISIYGEPNSEARLITSRINQVFQRLHNDLHAWKPSKLSTINRKIAHNEGAYTSKEIAHILEEATTLSSTSAGLFNPAIGHLIAAWGFQNDAFKPIKIDANKINRLVAGNPQMTDLIIDDKKVSSSNPHVKLDLGGVAKGYALDIGLKILKEQGVKNALINIGGNVIALGKRGDKPWRVGIQHPRKPNAMATLALDSGWAIGTSGDYQRYFMLDGKRYCHIIDPRTGYPAQGTQAVTVLIPPQNIAGMLSDFTSKPIFIASAENKASTINNIGVKDVMIIQDDSHIMVTPSMQKRLQWLDTNAEKHVKTLL